MRTIAAVGTAVGARARNPAPVGGGLAKAKANVLACDQGLPGSTRRFTFHRGAPAATAHAGQAPRCVAFRQIWCHVCAHRAKLPGNLAGTPATEVREARGPGKADPAELTFPEKQAAPLAGAPPRSTSCLATKRAPSLSVRATVLYLAVWPGLTRLPRLVARGYLAAVPGRSDVRTTVLTRNPQPEKTLA